MPPSRRFPVAAATALLVSLFAAGSAAAWSQAVTLTRDGVAATDPAVAASLPRYLQSRSAHFVGWLADGSMLIATRFGDTRQIHRVRAPLGMREQVSFAATGVIRAAARPFASDAFAYLAPHGEGTQLFLQPLGGHAREALTDGSEDDGPPVWAPDGRRIAFTRGRRDGVDVDVLDTATRGAVPRLLVAGSGHRWRIFGWSADQRRLLLGREPAPPGAAGTTDGGTAASVATLYIADVDSGSVTAVAASATDAAKSRHHRSSEAGDAPGSAPVQAVAARFAADGHGIVLLTRQQSARGNLTESQYLHLSYLNLSDGPARAGRWRELSAPAPHDVELFDQSADGHYLAYTLNDDGRSRLVLLDQQLALSVPVTTLPPGIISSIKFDRSGTRLALTLETARAPADVYVYEPGAGKLTRWTHSEVGALDTRSFVQPRRLQFSTWDRLDGQPRQLPMWVYGPGDRTGRGAGTGPAAARAEGPRPVVIWLCSGGGAQCRPRFAPFVQYLVRQLGCVVIAPNVRGSSGFSLSLLRAGEGALSGDAARDIGSLLVWIGLQPGLDRQRVALLGEGYGSYLALISLAQYGDRLQGAVAAFPSRLSGVPNVLAIRRPVLLVQGLDDPAVPPYQAAQLREGLRAQGVAVQYLAASGEGQDFSHSASRAAYHLAAASFLARLLLRPAGPSAATAAAGTPRSPAATSPTG